MKQREKMIKEEKREIITSREEGDVRRELGEGTIDEQHVRHLH